MDQTEGYAGLEYMQELFSPKNPDQQNPIALPFSQVPRLRNWSQLIEDVLHLISDRLTFSPHLQKFAACCKNWHLIAKEKGHVFDAHAPILLLPYNETTKRSSFFTLKKSLIYDLYIPELESHWICGSSNGWLGTVNINNLDLGLFNPLTRTQIPLPKLDKVTTEEYFELLSRRDISVSFVRCSFVNKIAVMEDPSSSNFLVAVIFSGDKRLGLCRLGDKDWTMLSARKKPDPPSHGGIIMGELYRCFDDIICHNGKVYALETTSVKVIDYIGADNVNTIASINIPMDEEEYPIEFFRYYLVMSCGDLLFVGRFGNTYPLRRVKRSRIAKTTNFIVYRLGKDLKTWTRVYDLAGETFFVGYNSSISVSNEKLPWLKPNCIYFTNDNHLRYQIQGGGYQADNGIFCLKENRVVESFNIQHSLSLWPTPAIWCIS